LITAVEPARPLRHDPPTPAERCVNGDDMSDTDIALLLFLAIVFLGSWQATSFKSPWRR
jgi:hypothetical protein